MDEPKSIDSISRDEYAEYLNDLFFRSLRKDSFGTLCALLRVSGLQDAGWDPFEESVEAFEDYNWLLEKATSERSEKSGWRVGLLMYCQLVEMTAPHELLENFLRIISGEKYHLRPFGHLIRTKNKQLFSSIPPSAKVKFRELKKSAEKSSENDLIEFINSFFNDDVRNAFFHSDYIITEKYFRWTESGLAKQIQLETLNTIITNCFYFYGALLWCHKYWLKELAKTPKFHKWPQYEILEILSNEDTGVYGFNVHFSNGNKATYSRTEKGTECTNLTIENDGSINFFVGSLDDLERVWKVNGEPVSASKLKKLNRNSSDTDKSIIYETKS
jgi:hypothetical protein